MVFVVTLIEVCFLSVHLSAYPFQLDKGGLDISVGMRDTSDESKRAVKCCGDDVTETDPQGQ